MQVELAKSHSQLSEKVPDLERNIEIVTHLQTTMLEQGTDAIINSRYKLSDLVFANAEIDANGIVGIWLGANVMVEYSYDEALTILRSNLEGTRARLADMDNDLNFLSDQITATEVSIARVFNYETRLKREEKKRVESAALKASPN